MSSERDAETERAAERAALARGERPRPGQAKLEEAERQRAQPSNGTNASEAPAPAASSSDGAGFGSFWTVAALAVLLIGASIVLGHWSSGLWLSVLALLLIGALWPPLGILIGGVALFGVFFRHHAELIQHITGGQA